MFDAEKAPVARSRGALVFAGVLLAALLVVLVAWRAEITQSWGLSGEQGELVVDGCSSNYGIANEQQRTTCRGEFTPDDGGEPYVVEALVSADPGDRLSVGADGPDAAAYRSDLWGRWASSWLLLIPLAFLWVLPWARWFMRGSGPRASRSQTVQFLGLGVAPFAVLLLAGVVGFFVALAIS